MSQIRFFAVILLTLIVGGSCQRRPLETELESRFALVPITIDWSKSGLDVEQILHASIWFFPEGGGKPETIILQDENKIKSVVKLPAGVYSVLVFNEMIDSKRLPGVNFRGIDKWETFEAYAGEISEFDSPLGSKTETLIKRRPPVAMATWSLRRFEVTEDMISITRTRSKASTKTKSKSSADGDTRASKADEELNKLLAITPLTITQNIEISAKVANLYKALSSVITISGAVEGVFLSTKEKRFTKVAHPLSILPDFWIFDSVNSPNGMVKTNTTVFGLSSDVGQVNILLDFILINGKPLDEPPVFDVSDQVKKSGTDKIIIKIGIENKPSVNPSDPTLPPYDTIISLPDAVTGGDVSVDGWGKVEIIIK